MVKACIVRGCRKESHPGCGATFHQLPNNEDMKKKWMAVVPGRFGPFAVVCSKHFRNEDYLTQAKVRLKPQAIPSIFPQSLVDIPSTSQLVNADEDLDDPGSDLGDEFDDELDEHIIRPVTKQQPSANDDKLSQLVHDIFTIGLTCDICGGSIAGHRYICLQCLDVNLCSSCEATGFHPEHAVLRLPSAILYNVIEPCLGPLRDALQDKLRNPQPDQAEIALEVKRELPDDTYQGAETESLLDTEPSRTIGPTEDVSNIPDEQHLNLQLTNNEPMIVVTGPTEEDVDPLIKTEYEDTLEDTDPNIDIVEHREEIERLATSMISTSESCRTVPLQPSTSETRALTHVKTENVLKRKLTDASDINTSGDIISTKDFHIQTSGSHIIVSSSHKRKV